MHNGAPRLFVYSKVYVDMENLFLFSHTMGIGKEREFLITKMQRSENSVIVCERSARVENCPAQELLFSEWRARNMARLFLITTSQKTKLK